MYTPVGYLESTGTQWIDTGVIPSDSTGLYARYMPLANDQVYAGSYANSIRYYAPYWFDSGYVAYGWNLLNKISMSFNKNEIYDAYLNYYNDRKVIFGGIVLQNDLPQLNNTTQSLAIFAFGHFTSGFLPKKVRIYILKITVGNSMIKDYIPVIDSNSRPCMFDKVSRECYYNQGTGEFLYG